MLVKFLNMSCRSRPLSFNFIRVYCQYSNGNKTSSQKTADYHESRLIGELNNLNWSSFKQIITAKKLNLIQKFINSGGSITKFDDILQIKGISKKTVTDLRKFCESQVQNDQSNENSIDFPLISEYESNNFNENVQPKSFVNNNKSFILYDEGLPPIELSPPVTKSTDLFSNSDSSMKKWKSLKLILEPRLTKYDSIHSFASIYQDATGVACTQFSPISSQWDGGIKINTWNYHKLDTIGAKHVFQLCDQISHVANQLPASDIYIMDDHIKLQHFRKAITPKRIAEIVQMSQQLAILVTLLQNKNSHVEKTQPNVFSMNYSIVARLYDLFVGREAISTENIIRNILYNTNKNSEEILDLLQIELNDSVKKTYFKSYPVERECLGKSMLIGLTFIRLGLLKTNK